ncbi:hypothetical protein O6H91_02G142400 [Diphasiastrum complanatum]|uniref:Uncharacterized protein n=1 Tax=Diphasiastrum complanatum TaxID=34168 RepID=A0ACC2ELJ7_DIPCM|nr:hypothetical protein O6H91_02G142400 [Diphasiastrum complanatum]
MATKLVPRASSLGLLAPLRRYHALLPRPPRLPWLRVPSCPLRSHLGSRLGCLTLCSAEVSTLPKQQLSSSLPFSESLQWTSRSHGCGVLSEDHVGQKVRVCGWVAQHRSHGAVTFLNIRDHTGIIQVKTGPESSPQIRLVADHLRLEYVVTVEGTVQFRPQDAINSKISTGTIEITAENIKLLNPVRATLPFLVTVPDDLKDATSEEVRLRYRHLDLRRHQMSKNLRVRHRIVKIIRRFLEDVHDFVEIETPILSRSTPEGARDYLVPSRMQPGQFYALPQSPQLFKQMLMVSGFDRYYQFARCFRDEDLRADRQPEFTQLDMELSFTPLDDMLSINEDLIRLVFHEIKNVELPNPFLRITYAEAMSRYGSDKPDIRFGMELVEVSDLFLDSTFKAFSSEVGTGGVVKAISIPDGATKISSSRLKKGDIYQEALKCGAKALPFLKVTEGRSLDGSVVLKEGLSVEKQGIMLNRLISDADDLILFVAGSHHLVNRVLGHLRLYIADNLGLIDKSLDAVLWVTEFPMFEWNSSEQRLEALHHPFTAPHPEDMGNLNVARALAYDMIYNGVEIGGGSLRIYRRDIQEKILEAIGLSLEQAEDKFGYLLEALDLGAPPHGCSRFRKSIGGIAYGLDRLVMLLVGEKSIRDVIAFPKTTTAQCSLTKAPASVDKKQLQELGL